MNVKNSGPIIMEELKLIQVMIRLYYSKHTTTDIPEKRMFAYAQKRLLFCPFGEKKTTCQKCPVHCYQSRYRQQMKQIMRYAGPRMLLAHPLLTVRHAYRGLTRRVEK